MSLESTSFMEEQETPLSESRQWYLTQLIERNQGATERVPFDLSRLYPETEQVEELREQVDDLKRCLDSFRPLDPTQLEKLEEYFEEEYTYESNRIEGNTLSFRETSLVIHEGITVGGKSLREHLEVINHSEAIHYIKDLVQNKAEFREYELKCIHNLVLRGIDRDNAGSYRRVPVQIRGSKHTPPQPHELMKLMEEYFEFYRQNKEHLHPVLLAADLHEKLVTVHPFIDGNGRTSRLVMNLILIQHGFPIANLSGEREARIQYFDALEFTQTKNDSTQFHRLIFKNVKRSLFNYLSMVINPNDTNKGGYFFEHIERVMNEDDRKQKTIS